MHALKCEASSLTGSELLSVLVRPDGSQTKLDDCVAQVVTIQAGGGGEVTALALTPKTAFKVGLETVGERTPLTMKTTMVKGENYDWFQQWDRMMVWRPKEGLLSDTRAKAKLLAALRRQLERRGPRNKPRAGGGVVSRSLWGTLARLARYPEWEWRDAGAGGRRYRGCDAPCGPLGVGGAHGAGSQGVAAGVARVGRVEDCALERRRGPGGHTGEAHTRNEEPPVQGRVRSGGRGGRPEPAPTTLCRTQF
ncbi:hypothetical protein GNI_153540 [Gregarina niphandrodes]|uniref:Uncharacterized protein n=1 Tax=Gregarina niphandrodes TaxID=110365 RepID=A0A023AZE2_GRENI|nr:hypothetical protein GNI_153540 [Gregarina niphandrodes]EZG44031.1 hypothetical protein GNI_153540 [Gregarina niphandrodes]|eukprot:XP_011132837.1 hypothetical protein GNI_153540 [Gregarina niphandrodes]